MKKKTLIIVFFIFLLAVFCAYGSTLGGAFIWDDKALVRDNALVTGPFSWSRVFGTELYQGWRANYYRPLVTVSFALNGIVGRFQPFGYHLANLLLHFFVGCLAYLFLSRMTGRVFLSFAAVLIFLVHPLHGQVVSYISGRADSLAALFIFLALLLYGRPGAVAFAGSVLCFALSLLAKESAIVLPVVLAGWEASFGPASRPAAGGLAQGQGTGMVSSAGRVLSGPRAPVPLGFGPGRMRRLMLFAIVAAGYAVLRLTTWNFAAGHPILSKAGFAVFEIGPWTRLFLFGKSLLIYLGSFFIPVGLHMERSVPYETVTPAAWLGVSFAAALAFFLSRAGREASFRRRTLFFVFWFFIWLLPQSALVFPKIMAEHFLYLPSLALCFFLASLIDSLPTRAIRWAVLALACLFFGLLSLVNNRNWADEETFFEHTVRQAPTSVRARDSLAALYMESGRLDEAKRQYGEILARVEKGPQGAMVRASAYYNLGIIYGKKGRIPEALAAYQNALALRPDMVEAHNNAGLILQRMGRIGEAEASFRKAIAADNKYCQAYNNLAQLFARQGRMEEALELWQRALDVCPDYEIARKNIGIAREMSGS